MSLMQINVSAVKRHNLPAGSALGGDVATIRKLAVRSLILVKFLTVLLLIAFLLGGPLPPAMAASIAPHPCQSITIAHGAHIVVSSHACPDTPMKASMSGNCVGMIGCSIGSVFGIPEPTRGHIICEGDESIYWMSVSLLAGRTVPPDLSPPIALI